MLIKSVVCFGCGDLGKYFVRSYESYVMIEYFLDNGLTSEKTFCGYTRLIPSKQSCRAKFIVVTNIKYYREISAQLRSYKLIEGKDFISIIEFEKRYPTIRNRLRTIKCWFVDFWDGFDPYNNVFTSLIKNEYNIILDEKDPDFLFCSCFGRRRKAFLYQCPRIFFTGENLIPDFNVYDYAIGFAFIDFGDRYIRWPLYRFYSSFELAKKKHVEYDMENFMKRDFCCRVVSASDCGYRERLFDELNKRKYVASGGRCKNNLPDRRCVDDKMDFLSRYKFNLAAENSDTDGYVTEKIIQAWAAGCIPVYWGSTGTIKQEFNSDAFVDCSDFATVSEVADYLLELENDRGALEKILSASISLNSSIKDNDVLERFLRDIFDKPESKRIQRLSAKGRYARMHEQIYLK